MKCRVSSVTFGTVRHVRTEQARTGPAGARRMAHASSINEKRLTV